MEAPTTAGTISHSASEEAFSHMVSHIIELFTQPSVAEDLTTTSAHMTETISDTSVGVLRTTSAQMIETISDTSVGALTTTFLQKTETIPDAFVGVLRTTSAQMIETISDTSVGVLTTTSAHMTETTSDAFLVGAAIVKGVSFEVLFVGVILVVVLVVVLVLVLVLCHNGKHKGTYHTNEAECGDSDSVDTYGVASQSELEILNEEE
ncbi:cell adhesion molecule 2 isoform X1 [Oncorhynchus tshawytscha]|uniref:cell adhesion molecule 2 isoform X1 n=1 Tax=Oncorhynchus tshawytscha TaxID=74940 RepID=UPI001C3CD21D|nr:cell adhesion molecule 2 isoform X1 [Oncorhynchus tshawytscha]